MEEKKDVEWSRCVTGRPVKFVKDRVLCDHGRESRSSPKKVSSLISVLPVQHAKVSLDKILNPEVPLMDVQSVLEEVLHCMNVWVNV